MIMKPLSLSPSSFLTPMVFSTLVFVTYLIGAAIYNLYLSPLAQFPGPIIWVCSRLPYLRALQKGDLVHRLKELHDQYGDAVRIAPDEISFTSASAWRDIYGISPGHKDFQKNPTWIRPQVNGKYSIHGAPLPDHTRYRKLLAHAFSDKAIRQQEPILQSYVDLLINRLREIVPASSSSAIAVDIGKWYNFVTFDIMGDLSLGESFHCLDESKYHPWVSLLFSSFKAAALFTSCRYLPGMERLLNLALPKSVAQKRQDHFDMTKSKIDRRLEQTGTDQRHNDFMAYVLRYNDEKGMTVPEIEATFPFVVLAGSETTATTLAGITNCLINNPETLQALIREIRASFASETDVTFESISKLSYLGAVIDEGLRICAPVALGSPRVVPAGGSTVDGTRLPGGTQVLASHYTTFRSPTNFSRPNTFDPSRWLPPNPAAATYPGFHPFSLGPRNCIGRNLAYLEMRLVLAKLLWHFDLERIGRKWEWEEQKTWILWEKWGLDVGVRRRDVA